MTHATRTPQQRFRELNRSYFAGRLPDFRVRRDFKAGAPCFCNVASKVIHLAVDTDELEAALLHEMVHIVTGGEHDDAFRDELRRIARMGCEAAARELEQEEWHHRTVIAAMAVDVCLSFAEARAAIMAMAGEHPRVKDALPMRGLNVWRKRAVEHVRQEEATL